MTRGTDFNMCPPTGGLRNYRKGYEDGVNRGKAELAEILDKISAEIKEIKYPEGRKSCLDAEYFVNEGLDRALDIIEKYKGDKE